MRVVRQGGDGQGVRVAMLRPVDRIDMMVMVVVVVGDRNGGGVLVRVLGVSIFIFIFSFFNLS